MSTGNKKQTSLSGTLLNQREARKALESESDQKRDGHDVENDENVEFKLKDGFMLRHPSRMTKQHAEDN